MTTFNTVLATTYVCRKIFINGSYLIAAFHILNLVNILYHKFLYRIGEDDLKLDAALNNSRMD